MSLADPLFWGWSRGSEVIAKLFWGWPKGQRTCPGALGDGGICTISPFSTGFASIQAITGGAATIQTITGGKVRIHES